MCGGGGISLSNHPNFLLGQQCWDSVVSFQKAWPSLQNSAVAESMPCEGVQALLSSVFSKIHAGAPASQGNLQGNGELRSTF